MLTEIKDHLEKNLRKRIERVIKHLTNQNYGDVSDRSSTLEEIDP